MSLILGLRSEHFITVLEKYSYDFTRSISIIEKICRMKVVNFKTCLGILDNENMDEYPSLYKEQLEMIEKRKEEL